MRLRRLDLTRYGRFTDQTIDFGATETGVPDLHIIYGLNEAGKSTTFAAYLDLLFGMGYENKYNFKHDYSAMQIGARLEFDGGAHELVRIKKRINSLLDERGQPVNEAMLSAALGGITRDAYRTMFSLDDQSLKDGGNAIIQSKGELGELLFEASSGLAGLSRQLVSAADEANAIYKKRSSSTQLAELKKTLVTLKAERDQIDTFAAAYQALTATHSQAETAYGAAMTELADLSTKQAELGRILGALPLAGEFARLSQTLAALGDLPRPPSEWFALLPELSRDETRLQALIESTDRNIAQLTSAIAAIAVDDDMLGVAAKIAALDDGRARYRTAENDLPKRRIAHAEQDAMVQSILADLEQGAHQRPEDLLLPAWLTGTIRDLIETRSGVDAELAAATRELRRTEDSLERLVKQGSAEVADAATPEAIATIEKALARLDGSDLQSRLTIEERTLAQQQRAFQAQLALLAPWNGDAEELRLLRAADPRQIEAWRAEANAIGRRIADHQARLRDLTTDQRQAKARIATFATQNPVGDGEARKMRLDRDAAWQEHLRQLDNASARTFEVKLSQDDALSAERLARAQDIAELRQLTHLVATADDAIERQQELLDEAMAEGAALTEKVAALLPPDLGVAADITESLPALESWTARRSQTLAAWDLLQQAETRAREIRSDLERHAAALSSALQEAGFDDADLLPPPALARTAAELLGNVKNQQAAHATQEKTLANLERDLAERRRDRDDAQAATDAWQQAWQDALAKTWFADKAGSVPAVREILKVLAALPGMLRERDTMAQRVATMERDQTQFRAEISAILDELGETLDSDDDALAAGDALVSRHNAALRARQLQSDRQATLDSLIETRHALEEQLKVHNARRTELTVFFGTDTLAAVSHALEQVRDRERLESRITELGQQMTDGLRTTSFDQAQTLLAEIDSADVERQASELSARIADLTERTRQLYADMTRARDRLDSVGGDDAVARIEAQRHTIFLEIEDLALRYLKLKAGTAAAEQALHLYREKHRSSMMNRASEAFRTITGGNYAGLAARPDKDKEILIGVTSDGGSKLADAMSTGTQFQLYLALRLAGYEESAAVRSSVPFIADDIMESFDNPRSEQVFRLLGEMAGIGQVIYLTHHWHLCEIARSVVPGVKIHEIG